MQIPPPSTSLRVGMGMRVVGSGDVAGLRLYKSYRQTERLRASIFLHWGFFGANASLSAREKITGARSFDSSGCACK